MIASSFPSVSRPYLATTRGRSSNNSSATGVDANVGTVIDDDSADIEPVGEVEGGVEVAREEGRV